jgi:hypothetical protein
MIPDTTEITMEEARMELINETKGAFIAQDYEIQQYNMGFDMLNFGGIFLLLGSLVFNYIIAPKKQKTHLDHTNETYALRKNGFLKGNIIEWTCMILFLFAFFTFFNNIFFYIILLSFAIGIIGFAIRKFNSYKKNLIVRT